MSNTAALSKTSPGLPNGGGHTAPQAVIECPRCQTKFAVEAATIAALENPRFHCSRCDAVFGLPEELPTLQPILAKQQSTPASPTQTPPTPTPQPPPPTPEPQIEAKEESAPIESTKSSTPVCADDFSFGHTIARPTTPTIPAIPSLLEPKKLKTKPIEEKPIPEVPAAPASKKAKNSKGEKVSPGLKVPTQLSLSFVRPNDRWRGFFVVASGLACCLAILVFTSYILRINPNLGNALAFGIPGAPSLHPREIPPPTVLIRSARFDRVPLANGEKIPVVIGRLMNGSNESFSRIDVEAMTFDEQGNLLTTSTIPVRLISERSKLVGLDRARVVDLIRKSSPNAAVKAGEDLSFAIPLVGEDFPSGKPRYFSARVHSVQR